MLFVLWISNFNSYWACDYLSMLELTLMHVSKKGLDCINSVLFVLGDLAICLHGCTWTTLGQGLSLIGNVVSPYSIHVIFELFEAFDLRATHDMIISIINIFWLHWIINRLVVMHPHALSHNKAVLNWNNFVWSIRLILIQGLTASTM